MITNAGSNFVSAPVGAHLGILTKIVDLGTQISEYPPGSGEEIKRTQQIWTWELPNELMEDGQPFIVSKFYTKSLGEKATLTKDLTSWLGKTPKVPFDDETLLGKSCQVIVTGRENSDKIKVSGLAPVPKGMPSPKQAHNPLVYFSLDNFNQEVFDGLSAWTQGTIAKSPEYQNIVGGEIEVEQPDGDEDIPF